MLRLAEADAGVSLTESIVAVADPVSGIYLSHPESYYFGVAKVERDRDHIEHDLVVQVMNERYEPVAQIIGRPGLPVEIVGPGAPLSGSFQHPEN